LPRHCRLTRGLIRILINAAQGAVAIPRFLPNFSQSTLSGVR
jgi:hypothetical protein